MHQQKNVLTNVIFHADRALEDLKFIQLPWEDVKFSFSISSFWWIVDHVLEDFIFTLAICILSQSRQFHLHFFLFNKCALFICSCIVSSTFVLGQWSYCT